MDRAAAPLCCLASASRGTEIEKSCSYHCTSTRCPSLLPSVRMLLRCGGQARCRGGTAAAQHISGCFASVSAHSRPRPCSLLGDLISPVAAAVQNLIPSTRESIVAGDALGDLVALLLALAVVAFVVIILHGIIRASQHFRDLKLEAKEANAEIEQQRMDHVAGLERKMAAPFVPNDDHTAI